MKNGLLKTKLQLGRYCNKTSQNKICLIRQITKLLYVKTINKIAIIECLFEKKIHNLSRVLFFVRYLHSKRSFFPDAITFTLVSRSCYLDYYWLCNRYVRSLSNTLINTIHEMVRLASFVSGRECRLGKASKLIVEVKWFLLNWRTEHRAPSYFQIMSNFYTLLILENNCFCYSILYWSWPYL